MLTTSPVPCGRTLLALALAFALTYRLRGSILAQFASAASNATARSSASPSLFEAACRHNITGAEVFETFGTSLSGKTAIVTGGNSGIGFALAKALARRGCTVVIASHDIGRAKAAQIEIRQLTGNDKVLALKLDLASFASVQSFAGHCLRILRGLDYLFLNAGTILNTGRVTEDGYEEIFQVNFLGHALLTELLMDLLRGAGGLVASTSSGLSENACEMLGACQTRHCDCASNFTWLPPPIVTSVPVVLHFATGPHEVLKSTYGISKWAQIYWTKALASREHLLGSNVRALSWTPGVVLTSLALNFTSGTWDFTNGTWNFPGFWLPDQAAAVPALFVAAPDRFNDGAYYSRDIMCQIRNPVDHGLTKEMSQVLLARVNEWTNVGDRSLHLSQA